MKKALGRGIDALFSEHGLEEAEASLVQVPVRLIDRNESQPRTDFDEESLQALADSIASVGIIQPLTVERNGKRYTLIAGERRWRAARLAGLSEVPCLIVEAEDKKKSEIALIENLQREDLNPVDKAIALKTYMTANSLTQEQASQRLGLSRPALANLIRILRLPEEVLTLLKEGKLTEGHARALCTLTDRERIVSLAQKVAALDLSVRQTELLCRNAEKTGKPAKNRRDDAFDEVVDNLRRALGTQVAIRGTEKKGQVLISYSSREELERIYELLCEKR